MSYLRMGNMLLLAALGVLLECQIVCYGARLPQNDPIGDSIRNIQNGRNLQQKDGSVCELFEGMNLPDGENLNNGNEVKFDTAEECCTYCQNFPGCEAFTYITAKTTYTEKNSCWLKRRDDRKVPCFVCVSGLLPSHLVKPRTEEDCFRMPGMDMKGGDIDESKALSVESQEECCRKCDEDFRCKAWTMTAKGRCFTKNEIKPLSICDTCEATGILERRLTSADVEVVSDVLKAAVETSGGELKDKVNKFLSKVKDMVGKETPAESGQTSPIIQRAQIGGD